MSQGPFLNPKFPKIWHGGDYNPEQWPKSVWDEDMRLMQDAHFHCASIGIFSWAHLEPEEDRFEFDWLDDVIDRLAKADRWFLLATPSAAAPAWMAKKHPEILRTGADRVRRLHGNRVNYNLASGYYRTKCRHIAELLAKRYGSHPRLLAWHLSNEYGGYDYGSESTEEFRLWLKRKFNEDLDALNNAYWTSFWSHKYTSWDQIEPPGEPYGDTATVGLNVDWRRFSTDQTISFMLNEAAPLKEISPSVPITTNLMGTYSELDYRKFAEHLDFISWDSYPGFESHFTDKKIWLSTAFKHDLMRSLKPDRPWLLMECSPSSGNWYPYMFLKPPGTHRFESVQAIAHGADGVQYFQWRQGRGAFEQWHGAVVAHAGAENTRVYREVRALGIELDSLDAVVGTTPDPEVAIYFDWETRWALEASCGPSRTTKEYEKTVIEHYKAFWELGVPVNLIGQDDDLDKYRLVVAPMLYSLRPNVTKRLTEFVENGGTVVATYLTGWTDENSLAFEGGAMAPLRKLFGIWSEELDVLPPGMSNALALTNDIHLRSREDFVLTDFCELIHSDGAEVLATYRENWYAGRPAVTRNAYGNGTAYYVASRTNEQFHDAFFRHLVDTLNIKRAIDGELPAGVTAQRRTGDSASYLFLLNTNDIAQVVVTSQGLRIELPPRGVAVVRDA